MAVRQCQCHQLIRKVLFEYHPLEPEVVLQLSQATFQHWEFGTVMNGRRSVRAPHPGNAEQPDLCNNTRIARSEKTACLY